MFTAAALAVVTPTMESRSISFENPTGARGAGGAECGGRKGAAMRVIRPGERIVLADIEGPGTIRHIWMTFPPAAPEEMRAKLIEVFYDGHAEPSVSVPALDFFGIPWGRPVHLDSALTTLSEGRGFNTFIPIPFQSSIRIEYVNAGQRKAHLYYQVDYTLESALPEGTGYLHASYRRQNPTVMGQDFVIAEGLQGPGRFLGCVVGVRVLDSGFWYGEGEVKMYIDGDDQLPTICGTGLEDYVGTAWAMGAHYTQYMGSPLIVKDPEAASGMPDFVGFYRWHVMDPVMFKQTLRVTIQQIGFEIFLEGQQDQMDGKQPAGRGWLTPKLPGLIALGLAERVDDYCATAFIMCAHPQAVPRVQLAEALDGIGRLPYEGPSASEQSLLLDIG